MKVQIQKFHDDDDETTKKQTDKIYRQANKWIEKQTKESQLNQQKNKRGNKWMNQQA